MSILNKLNPIAVINSIEAKKKFSESDNCYDFVVVAGKYPNFKAIKDKDNCTLYILFDKYIFKKNDQIIDASDISYFVKEVDSNFDYKIGTETFRVQKIVYDEQPLPLPNYISQNINTNIHIDASGANLNDINVNNSSTQQLSFSQYLTDLENTINNCYHIKDYKEMIAEIRKSVDNKKPIEQSRFKKFLGFMGTQVRRLFDLFLTAYATALAEKTLGKI